MNAGAEPSDRPGPPSSVRADVADEQFGPFARSSRRRRRTLRSWRAATVTTATLAQASPQGDLASEQQTGREARERRSRRTATASPCSTSSTRTRELAIQNATDQINTDEAALKEKARETERGARPARSPRRRALHGRRQPCTARPRSTSSSAGELGTRSQYAGAAADQDRQLLDEVKVAVEQLGIQQKSLEQAHAAAVEAARQARRPAQRRSTQATKQQQDLLAQVKGNIKTLVDQIQAEQPARAGSRGASVDGAGRATAGGRRASAQQAQEAASHQSGSSSSGGSIRPRPVRPRSNVAPRRARHAQRRRRDREGAARQALRVRRLRAPTRSTAPGSRCTRGPPPACRSPTTPKPSTSRSPTSTSDQLEPGDLVFFGSPIHHVGIFVGGGTMIEAPYTGVDVRYHSIYRPDFAGAARP